MFVCVCVCVCVCVFVCVCVRESFNKLVDFFEKSNIHFFSRFFFCKFRIRL